MLSPVVWIKDQCVGWWNNYVALVGVAEENARLREDLRRARVLANLSAEDRAELTRLRELFRLNTLYESPVSAARVIARRFGPFSARKTFTISKGYLDGALVGTPVITQSGVVGRVLRAAPHAATVLMITDPGFRVAVISQESRTPGILTGSAGHEGRLEVAYVAQNARVSPGEILITAGGNNDFPKGIPVGVVTLVTPGNEILFQQVHAQPLADLDRLEEVLLLQEDGSGPTFLEQHRPERIETDFTEPPEWQLLPPREGVPSGSEPAVEEHPSTQNQAPPSPEEAVSPARQGASRPAVRGSSGRQPSPAPAPPRNSPARDGRAAAAPDRSQPPPPPAAPSDAPRPPAP